MADKKETKTVITEKDQEELINLLQTFKTAILGHEARLATLEQAVATIHGALTRGKNKQKLIVPTGARMDIPKG